MDAEENGKEQSKQNANASSCTTMSCVLHFVQYKSHNVQLCFKQGLTPYTLSSGAAWILLKNPMNIFSQLIACLILEGRDALIASVQYVRSACRFL